MLANPVNHQSATYPRQIKVKVPLYVAEFYRVHHPPSHNNSPIAFLTLHPSTPYMGYPDCRERICEDVVIGIPESVFTYRMHRDKHNNLPPVEAQLASYMCWQFRQTFKVFLEGTGYTGGKGFKKVYTRFCQQYSVEAWGIDAARQLYLRLLNNQLASH